MRAILTYHSIDESGSPVSVAPGDFRRHVEWLAASDVRVVSLRDLLALPDDVHACSITFDDAFLNFRDTAWPILSDHDLPVTLFVVSGHVGGTNAWGGVPDAGIPTLPLMNWSDLAAVATEGVELGAHTVSHPRLSTLSSQALTEELEQGRSGILEHTGQTAGTLAYPYGDVNDAVVREAQRLYEAAVTTRLATLGAAAPPHRLPRLDAYYFREKGRLEDWGHPRFERYVAFRRGLRRVRAAFARGTA